jgi:hypothetical protein
MMSRLNVLVGKIFAVSSLLVMAVPALAADDAKQKVDAGGLSFEVPAGWKSTPPTSSMRRAQLKVEPIEGDGYAAELVVTAFRGGAGSVQANLDRWQAQFKDKDGNPPSISSKRIKGKNVEVVVAETSGHFKPPQFGARAEPEREDARLLGAIVVTDDFSYFLKMVGPSKTVTKLKPEFDEMVKSISVEGK